MKIHELSIGLTLKSPSLVSRSHPVQIPVFFRVFLTPGNAFIGGCIIER